MPEFIADEIGVPELLETIGVSFLCINGFVYQYTPPTKTSLDSIEWHMHSTGPTFYLPQRASYSRALLGRFLLGISDFRRAVKMSGDEAEAFLANAIKGGVTRLTRQPATNKLSPESIKLLSEVHE